MKYRPLLKLKKGMLLGQDVLNGSGKVLMKEHRILDEEAIRNLEEWGFPGVYIDDSFTESIEIDTVIRPQIQAEALKLISNMYTTPQDKIVEKEKDKTVEEEEKRIRDMVQDIVGDITSDGDVMYNLLNLKNYDEYVYYHTLYVTMMSVHIGIRLGLSRDELNDLATAGLLHDIGRKFVDGHLQELKRPLAPEEMREIRRHVDEGTEFVGSNFHFSKDVVKAIQDHHENFDGTGYPNRLKGDKISIYARILHVADVYDALITKKPYRSEFRPADAMEYLMASDGQEFDPDIIQLFVDWVAVYPVGSEVRLSNGQTAIVEENYPHFPLRPRVRVVETGEEMDLRSDMSALSVVIVEMVKGDLFSSEMHDF